MPVKSIQVKDANGTTRDVPTIAASFAYYPSVTITRPANTTAYGAGDVLGGVLTLAGAGDVGDAILITGLTLELDVAAIPVGMTGFRLHLYDASPASALADNGVFDLTAGDRANYLGFIDIDAPEDLGSTLWAQTDALGKQLKLATSSSSLFAYLVTIGGFTPGSGDVYKLKLKTLSV